MQKGKNQVNKEIEIMETKTCTKCGIEKTLSEFHKNKHSSDGLKSRCKICNIEDYKAYRNRNIGKCREYGRKYSEEYRRLGKQKDCHDRWRKSDKGREYSANYMREQRKLKRHDFWENTDKGKSYNKNYSKEWQKIARDNLGDSYVIAKIKRCVDIPTEQIKQHPELIEAKRQTLKIKRL